MSTHFCGTADLARQRLLQRLRRQGMVPPPQTQTASAEPAAAQSPLEQLKAADADGKLTADERSQLEALSQKLAADGDGKTQAIVDTFLQVSHAGVRSAVLGALDDDRFTGQEARQLVGQVFDDGKLSRREDSSLRVVLRLLDETHLEWGAASMLEGALDLAAHREGPVSTSGDRYEIQNKFDDRVDAANVLLGKAGLVDKAEDIVGKYGSGVRPPVEQLAGLAAQGMPLDEISALIDTYPSGGFPKAYLAAQDQYQPLYAGRPRRGSAYFFGVPFTQGRGVYREALNAVDIAATWHMTHLLNDTQQAGVPLDLVVEALGEAKKRGENPAAAFREKGWVSSTRPMPDLPDVSYEKALQQRIDERKAGSRPYVDTLSMAFPMYLSDLGNDELTLLMAAGLTDKERDAYEASVVDGGFTALRASLLEKYGVVAQTDSRNPPLRASSILNADNLVKELERAGFVGEMETRWDGRGEGWEEAVWYSTTKRVLQNGHSWESLVEILKAATGQADLEKRMRATAPPMLADDEKAPPLPKRLEVSQAA